MHTISIIHILAISFASTSANVLCQTTSTGAVLNCTIGCCWNLQALPKEFYCCDGHQGEIALQRNTILANDAEIRPRRFVAISSNVPHIQIDYTLLITGLIISILLSVFCSMLCCILCNGFLWCRRRDPQIYETVQDSGYYPLCCGFGLPFGTIVLSTHPPQFRDESSLRSEVPMETFNRNRVRFQGDEKALDVPITIRH